MNFNGRWVPMEMMNTIFLLWAIAAVLVVAALFWFMRLGQSAKNRSKKTSGTTRERKNKRRKR
jgi:hypothetical protein